MPFEWADSAFDHGISPEDGLYVIANPAAFADIAGRGSGTTRLYVGHPHPFTDAYIEVMVTIRQPRTIAVFHMMELRDKYRYLLEGDQS